MTALGIFLSAFWLPFVGAVVVVWVVWLAKRAASNGYPPFISPRSFPELSGLSKTEQKRLLHEASGEAFRGGRLLLPIFLFAGIFASGVALGYMLPLIAAFPNSLWAWVCVSAVFAGIGGWAAGRLEKWAMKPVLRQRIAMDPSRQ